MANVTDLQTKYSKLAQEYSKLRAQNQVLKKAVVDEQGNSASLKDQLKQRDQSLRKQEQEMDSLSFRNQQLAKRVELLQEELAACEAKGKKGKQQLRRCQSELSRQLKQSSSVIQEKVPFNDTKFNEYNSLNVPSHNRRHQLKARDVTGQALSFIQDLVAALLNFHTYTEQRVHIYPLDSSIEPVSPLNQKVGVFLSIYMKTLLMCAPWRTETVVTLKAFADNFASYTHFLLKILPYQLKSLEEECEAPLCTAALTAKNQELQSDVKKVTSAFEKLQSYINLLALPSRGLLQTYLSLLQVYLVKLILFAVLCLEMSKHYNQKAGIERELPTVTQKLCTTSECLLGSLGSLTSVTGKIATFFSNNLDFFTSPAYSPRGSSLTLNPLQAEAMLANKQKAAAYIHAVRPQSVPYREALANRRILTSSTESREGLSQQVQQSQEKIARLEQEKEHWLLEAQLGKVRLEKENQRIVDLEAQLAAALGGSPNPQTAPASRLTQTHEEVEMEQNATGKEATLCTSLVGMLCTTPTNEHVGDEESREQLIKTHYMARVGELTTQLQISDSKAVHFHSECRALAKRLTIAEKARETLSEEVKLANQNITRLQDELTTTKRSYEDQLSMMSDHLCSMNETLSKQREEIDTLKLGGKANAKKNKGR
uniref:Protein phosphatase 1 regulatory subunit 21 n=1 Tax=Nothobranchius furzeri TaxID=105023 RepID=A0A8C6KXS2_NOTFU